MTPRGIRNNNPGNIEANDINWQGLAKPHQMSGAQQAENRFAVFAEPKWGIRALARVLITYQTRHDLHTVESMIGRWAPPVENNTDAYVNQVCRAMDLEPNERFSMQDYGHAQAMVKAIIKHENGEQPYDDSTIDTALVLAGIEMPRRVPTPMNSRTMAGGAAAGAALAPAVVVEGVHIINEVQEQTATLPDYIGPAVMIVALLAVGWMVWAKVDDAMKGRMA